MEVLDDTKKLYDFIQTLPIDCMGIGSDEEAEYPIRDEVLDKLAHIIEQFGQLEFSHLSLVEHHKEHHKELEAIMRHSERLR